ncbi:DUF4296 domain-containing protein [Lacinutrix iliipiscaria]|uniref:DUF4296 domain-containing protein n=1 Tax=Lacinutrix iliipiscaria TaxID=1230532 RepID=A0ABW5WLT7_9FLAO
MRSLINICFVLLLVSCYDIKKPKKPDNLIAKDKMVNVIIDLSLFNSAKGINKRILEDKGINLEQYVYEQHDIDSLQFAESNNYYAHHIDDYEAIYKEVKDSLSQLKDKYTEIENKQKRIQQRRDSIRRAEIKDSIYRNKKGMKALTKDH